MKILITGAAGFIGSNLASKLAERGDTVVGIDNINTYYDPNLKYARFKEIYGIEVSSEWPCGTAVPETGTTRENETVTFPQMPFGVRFVSPLHQSLSFIRMDIADREALDALFAAEKFDAVMNHKSEAVTRSRIPMPILRATWWDL